uniref:PH domain-containing protein n=1 Tax=Panagrellus redivivus TaxID=6233 RepID=A0A7E4VED0_PANRE
MSDSDTDSFHSASEGEDNDIPARIDPVAKSPEALPSKTEQVLPTDLPAAAAEKIAALDAVLPPLEATKSDLTGYDGSGSSSPSEVSSNPTSPTLTKKKESTDEGWENFGDEADSEGGDESSPVGSGSDEGEYYHRQAKVDKKTSSDSASLWEQVEPAKQVRTNSAGGGLFDWRAISNVVSAVGEGFSSVVESGLGLPPPEEAARLSVAERRRLLEEAQHVKEPEPSLSSDEGGGGGNSPEGSLHGLHLHTHNQGNTSPPPTSTSAGDPFSNLFGGFGSIVNGSLDVLETLGKKTFETLTVKDETEKRRFILQPGREENLSDVLRELRENEESASVPGSPTGKMLGYGSTVAKTTGISFLREFDANDGLVHLECFEMLSKDYFADKVADKKFTKFDDQLANFCLEDVSECDTDEFLKGIKRSVTKFNLAYQPTPFLNCNTELTEELERFKHDVDTDLNITVEEFHKTAVVALAKLTSKTIESLCRLIQQMICSQTRPELSSIFTFTYLVCRRLSFFASQYANLLSLLEQNAQVEEAVTNIFFECSNSCLYLKKALELARPFFPDDGFLFNPTSSASSSRASSVKQPSKPAPKPAPSKDDDDWLEW